MKNKVVVLAEPMWTKGHYETQMYLFLSILLPRNCKVIVLCAEPEKVKEWTYDCLPEYRDKLFSAHFSLIDQKGEERFKSGQLWQYLSESLAKAEEESGWKIDIVFITSLDIMIYRSWRRLLLKRNFEYPWVGLYFMPIFRLRRTSLKYVKNIIKLKIFSKMNNSLGIAILDEGVYGKSQAFFNDRKISIFPDVTDERLPVPLPEKFAKIKAEAGSRTIIGLIGLLQKRKGLLNYLRSIQAMDNGKCYFLIAGYLPLREYSEEEQFEINRLITSIKGTNCHFEFNYIDDPAEVNAYIALCDVVYLCYENFYYSSGIMTKAAAFGKLMIVTEGYCMGERVEKYGFGLTVKEGDLDEIIHALKILTDDKTRQQMNKKAQFDKYMDFHNYKTLQTVLCDFLGVEN